MTTFTHRLLPAALITAATLGGSAIAASSIAYAEPKEWDIGFYDACMDLVYDDWVAGRISNVERDNRSRGCCVLSGGIAQPTPEGGFVCVAPPAEAGARPSRVPPGITIHTATPVPDPAPTAPLPTVISTR